MDNQITLSQALEGYLLHASARRLSPHTIVDYTNTFRKFQAHLSRDPALASITADQVRAFLASQNSITKKTLLNYHIGLSALWTWAIAEDLVSDHLLRRVDRPKPEQRAILPFTQSDLSAMLDACAHTQSYTRPGKRGCRNSRPTALRDRAILLVLLDTGIRASELVNLTTNTVNLKNRRILVEGKGSKERAIPISDRTAQAVWRYLSQRPTPRNNTSRLFLSDRGQPISRDALRRLVSRLGQRAGVAGAHPHRLRHTFAIQFLRNGGNAYVLQELLGHTTFEMTRKYLELTQLDFEISHTHASPVDHWNL